MSICIACCSYSDYSKLKRKNSDFGIYKDSLLLISYNLKEFDISDTTKWMNNVYHFYHGGNKLEVEFVNMNRPYNSKTQDSMLLFIDIDSLGNIYTDTVIQKTKTTFPVKNNYILENLPLSCNAFFDYKQYKRPHHIYFDSNSGTRIFEQKIRNFNRIRKIYADKNYIITKYEELNFDSNYTDAYSNFTLQFLPNMNYESYLQTKKLGMYLQVIKSPKQLKIDSLCSGKDLYHIYHQNQDTCLDLQSKYKLLDFWYISCYPCKKIMPVIESINKQINDSLIILGENRVDKEHDIKNYYNKYHLTTYQVLMPYNSLFKEITAYPTLILIDPQGNILRKWEGYYDSIYDEIVNELANHHLLLKYK